MTQPLDIKEWSASGTLTLPVKALDTKIYVDGWARHAPVGSLI